jgi:catechol 2,3-dioxygenase-like lactoylglutathione lyase family enzyme
MRNGLRGIDHVVVAVRDLERARQNWTRLGFALSPRGRHIGRATGNYCVMFAGDYVELLGIVDDAAPAQPRWLAFLAWREGLMAAAFAPAAAPEIARAGLASAGLNPSEPRPLSRRIELPEGTVEPSFSLIALPPEETPGLDCFICAQLTPELMRRPEWLRHPNGAERIIGIHVLVAETAPLLPAYDRLFGLPQVTTTDAVAVVRVGRHRITFSTPDDFLTMHPGLDLPADFPLPGMVSLELGVAERDATADYLRESRIPFGELPDGSLAVPAREANGAILCFAEQP